MASVAVLLLLALFARIAFKIARPKVGTVADLRGLLAAELHTAHLARTPG